MRHRFTRGAALIAAATAGAMLVASCADDDDDDAGGGAASPGSDEQIELVVATFGTFGYESDQAGLFDEYERLNPNITITHRHTGQGGPYHDALMVELAADTDIGDVVAIEEGHIGRIMPLADKFSDLNEIGPDTTGRWLDWKTARATTPDGKLIGYGTDIGPLAVCYRMDLFEEAGLPSEPEQVAPLFETWDSYFETGMEFIANSDSYWVDNATQPFNAMVNQLPVGFSDESNNLVIESNPDIRARWDLVTQAIQDDLVAGLPTFSEEWTAGFANNSFATSICPSWMLGVVEGNDPDHAGMWRVADAFPNGGGNWGGSWLTVPANSEHPAEAAALAAWLTAPEQQIKAFEASGTFPSQVDALDDPAVAEASNDFFGGQNVGTIFAARAAANPEPQWKAPHDGPVQENAASPALNAVSEGLSPEDGWEQFVTEAKRLAEAG